MFAKPVILNRSGNGNGPRCSRRRLRRNSRFNIGLNVGDFASSRFSFDNRGCTEPTRLAAADVASVARRPFRSFAKMDTNLPVPTTLRLNEISDDVIALPRARFLPGVR